MNWTKGDKVMWHFKNAPSMEVLIPAIVISSTAKRIRIRALLGDTKEERNVKPDRLSARAQHFTELDDE